MDKLAEFLNDQMYRLQKIVEKPSYESLKDKHIKSIRCLDNIIEIDDLIARQRKWLRSNLNALPEEKKKVKSRLDEMKKVKSELIDEYTNLQLP